MELAVYLIKQTLRPSSVTFILLGLALGVVLLYLKPTARWGRRWLTALLISYYLMSTPLGAGWLTFGLNRGQRPIVGETAARGAAAIVVLSGGAKQYRAGGAMLNVPSASSAFRVLEAARLYKLLGDPLVIVLGGVTDGSPAARPESEALRDALVRVGVPPDRIRIERVSQNTRTEALQLLPMLRALAIDRFVLVTSPTHLWRSTATFEALGMRPVPSPAAAQSEDAAAPLLMPNQTSLRISDEAVYNHGAIAYYWLRGWLRKS